MLTCETCGKPLPVRNHRFCGRACLQYMGNDHARKVTPKMRRQIRSLRKQGLTWDEVAAETGVSVSSGKRAVR